MKTVYSWSSPTSLELSPLECLKHLHLAVPVHFLAMKNTNQKDYIGDSSRPDFQRGRKGNLVYEKHTRKEELQQFESSLVFPCIQLNQDLGNGPKSFFIAGTKTNCLMLSIFINRQVL